MNRIIIYGSKYGTTKKYASELSKKLNSVVISYNDVVDLKNYDSIIYLGALYAGGVLGMSKTLKKINNPDGKELVLITIGLADPYDEQNVKTINKGIERQVTPEIFNQLNIFHLRGGIDYSKLDFKHKTMMRLLYNKAKKLPEEKQTAEVKTMIETYNSVVDFVDFEELDKIIAEIDNMEKVNHKSK